MLPLTEQQLTRYNEIFPELAPEQLETAVLYAMGKWEYLKSKLRIADRLRIPPSAEHLKK